MQVYTPLAPAWETLTMKRTDEASMLHRRDSSLSPGGGITPEH